jgi:plastocyanin
MPIRLYSCLLATLTATAVLVAACSQDAQPLRPSLGSTTASIDASDGTATAGTLAARVGGVERAVMLFDACDPTTFNAVLGPGGCTRNGGITFDNFIDQLTKHQSVGPWRFSPSVLTMKEGQTLVAENRGGETHTFTEVDEFGGGIVANLNQLAGLTTVAHECTQLKPGDFLAPGARATDTEDESGVEKYQCCIHPWMRAEIRISEK